MIASPNRANENKCPSERDVRLPKAVAIIPARGGSKGLYRKNIRLLSGKPLIAYSIEVALKTPSIDRVIVSTDDEEIAEIAVIHGAEVPFFRPAELSTDRADVGAAIHYTLNRLKSEGYDPEAVVTLYPTHPFRTPALVDFLTRKTLDGYNPVKTVKHVQHGSQSIFHLDDRGRLRPLLHSDNEAQRNETLRSYYRDYGLFFGQDRQAEVRPYLHVIKNPIELIDVDTLADFRLAEAVIEQGLFDFIGDAGETIDRHHPHPSDTRISTSAPMQSRSRHGDGCRVQFHRHTDQNLAILPVFLNEKDASWQSANGVQILYEILRQVSRAKKIHNIRVYTNSGTVNKMCDEMGVGVVALAKWKDTRRHTFLPEGTAAAMTHVTATEADPFAHLVTVDYRNPFITAELIDRAIDSMESSDAPVLLSLKKSVDHPCQLNTYYKVSDVGVIHRVDTGERSPSDQAAELTGKHHGGYRLTHPFHLDWQVHVTKPILPGNLYDRKRIGDSIVYVPVDTLEIAKLRESHAVLWVSEGSVEARLYMPVESWEQKMADGGHMKAPIRGWALNAAVSEPKAVLVEESSGGYYFKLLKSLETAPGPWLMRFIAVNQSPQELFSKWEVEVNHLEAPISLPLDMARAATLVFFVLKLAEDASYDLKEPFPASETLWFGKELKVNTRTGAVIMGRQDFPEVWEPDNTLFIVKQGAMQTFEAAVTAGQAIGFPLTDDQNLHLHTSLDWLRYQVEGVESQVDRNTERKTVANRYSYHADEI